MKESRKPLLFYFWKKFKESQGLAAVCFCKNLIDRILKNLEGSFWFVFWKSLKKSWRPVLFYFWRNFKESQVWGLFLKQFDRILRAPIANFWILKNLDIPIFQTILKMVGFQKILKYFESSLCFVFERVWKKSWGSLLLYFWKNFKES